MGEDSAEILINGFSNGTLTYPTMSDREVIFGRKYPSFYGLIREIRMYYPMGVSSPDY